MSRPEDDSTFDPNCDPLNPKRIKYDDVLAATRNCTGNVLRTPVIKSNLSEKLGIEIYHKLENMQLSGSFKYRGVMAALLNLTEEQKRYGVVTATNGNHGMALAMACGKLNIPCVIYFTVGAPAFRIHKSQECGAKCVVYGANIIEAKNEAIVFAKDKRMYYINGFDHPKMCEGNGSCGIEIIEQVPQVDAVIVPVGGGALITGVATAIKHLKPDTEIYGVETEVTCSMTEALRKNERTMILANETMVDMLRINMVGVNTFHSCKTLIDKMVVVKEDWVPRAILHLAEDDKLVVEPAGSCPMAACLAGLFPNLRGKTVVCVCSGGNICPSFMIRSIELGLSSEGRLVQFAVTVNDVPGAIGALCTLMSDIGIVIRDLIPERIQMEARINTLKKELLDPNCDPTNPRRIKYEDVKSACRNLSEVALRTPMIKSKLSEQLGMELYFKLEILQHTGSFKFRGVSNVLMSLDENQKKAGIVTCSTGNHAIATAYNCQVYQIPCVIFVPTGTPANKVIKCQTYGAKVVVVGPNSEETMKVAMTVARDKNMTYINGFDHPKMLEGNGTIGSEIIDQYPSVEAVLIPVGGGGLIAGVGVALKGLKPEVEVYGIESDKTSSMTESLSKNERVHYETLDTMCENLRVSVVGVNAFQTCKAVVDKMIIVTEDWIPRAITKLFEEDKIIVEAGGALPVAACLAGLLPYLKGKRVVCIMAGGNLNGQYFSRSLELGQAADGRLVKFKVTVKDKTSSVAELFNLLLSIGVSIRDCVPERAWVQGDVFSVEYTLIAETRGWENLKEMVTLIKKYYNHYEFQEFLKENMKHESTARRGPCLAPQPVCMQK